MLPDEPEVLGQAAALLLTDARRPGRTRDGELVPLADQDRTRWRWDDIDHGLRLAAEAVRRGSGPWVLQTSIAALQVAPVPDREAIVTLYDRLAVLSPSPAVLANRGGGRRAGQRTRGRP
ncbi:DUF6596 domain-containing protein [Nonomuraea sp. NPDC050310]|uniref:DUF6596 domain-containing protein n=1 Tax=Nonomuraea sp. NPDC050310 TaxID=3154935 RepID=UPI0033CE908E